MRMNREIERLEDLAREGINPPQPESTKFSTFSRVLQDVLEENLVSYDARLEWDAEEQSFFWVYNGMSLWARLSDDPLDILSVRGPAMFKIDHTAPLVPQIEEIRRSILAIDRNNTLVRNPERVSDRQTD